MADGVKNAGSVANEAGLGFEQFASIVAKVSEVTRQDGSQIGNTLKTTMARISRSQTGDPDVTGKDRSKAAEAYKDVLGIDLYGKNGEYRDLSDTLDLLASRWDSLTDAQKNYISEQSAGTRGINVFRSMMDNYKEIQKLTESALTDKDYYKSVQQKWADSVEGKRQGFEASKQQMWNSLLSSGTLGGLYDAGSMGVGFASSIVSGLKSFFDIPSKLFVPGKDNQNTLSTGTLGGLYDAGSMGVGFASSIVSGLKSFFDIPSKLFVPGKDNQNTLSTVLTSGVIGGAGMSTVEFYKKLMEEDAFSQPGGVKKAFKQSFAMFSPLAKVFTQSKKGVEGFLSAFKETGNQFKDNTKTTTRLSQAWSSLRDATGRTKDLEAIKAFKNSDRGANALQALKNTEMQSLTRLSQAWSSLRDATGRTKDLEAIKAFKNSDRGANALQALKNTEMQSLTGKIQSFALQHPVLTTAGASVAALGAVWSFVQGQIEKTEAQRQSKIDKATEQAQINDNNIQTLAQLRTYIEENKPTYQELAKGVHQGTNTNVSLSEAQFAKWTEMNNKIAELAPSTLSYRDKQGNAVLNSQSASELTKLIRVEEQRVATETINSLSTFVDSYKAQNERQGIFDKSDNIAGDINTRIKALEWLKNIDTKDIQKSNNLWSGLLNGGQSMFKDALRFGVNPTDLSEYFNNTLPIKLKDVTEENRESFNAGIDSAIDSLKSSQTEMNNNFRTIMPQMVEKARTKTGVFGLQDRDWDNLSSVLSAVPDDILNELTTSDDIQGAITDYADRWIDGMKNGGRPFANALQKVLTTDGMSSLKQMEATMNRFLPKISDTVGVDKEDLIKAFGLEDVKQTVQQNQMLRKEVEMGKYINEPIEAQRSAQSTKGVNTLKAQAENQTKTVKKDRTDDSELTQKSIFAGGNADKSLKQLNSDLGRSLTEQTRKQETAFKDIQSLKDNTKVSADYGREMLKSYNDFVNRNELNDVESFNALRQLLTEYGSQDWDLIQKKWDVDDVSLAKVSDKMGILENNLADIAANYDTVFKARASSAGASGMSDQEMVDIEAIFSKTKGFNYDKLFEGTATGIHMNVAELNRLTGEYKRFEQAKYDKQISDLTRRWQECNRVIAESVEGSQDWYDAIEKRDFLNDYINDAREFQSRFEGIVNPVNQFMASLKGAEEGDDYDLLAGDKGVKIVEDLYAKGLVGTNKFKNFAQMLTNEDLSEKGIEGYVQAYESRYGRFKELFTEDGITGIGNGLDLMRKAGLVKTDENGTERIIADVKELSNALIKELFTEDGITGIGNGLDLMRKAGLVKTDENGTERIIADVKELSNALNISDSLASTFMKKLSDYGIDTPFAEETDNMRDLRKAAESASQALSDTGKSFQVETDKTELKDVNKELDKIQKAKKKIGETDAYPNKEKDLQYLSQIEDYYKTLKGSKAVELYDTRTDKGQEQALDKVTALDEKTGIKIGIDWESENASYFAQQVDLVSACMDQLKSKDGTIHIETEGYEEAREVMEQLIHQKQVLTQPAILEYDTSGLESSETKNQFKKVQNLAGAIQNYREKQALEKSGFQLRDGEMEQARSSITSAWKELQTKFPEVAEGLQKEAGVKLDTNLETDDAIRALEKIVGQENIVEIMAELTGDQQVKNQLDEIVNQKYTAKIQASDYNAGSLNRYMHDAYDDSGQGTETFDYGSLDKQGISGMEASEVQVVAKVVNKGEVESLSDPVEKDVVVQYIENSSAWAGIDLENKHEILVDYVQGDVSYEELPTEIQQVIDRLIGQYIENSSAWAGIDLENKHEILVDYVQGDVSYEELPTEIQQVIDRLIGVDETQTPPPKLDAVSDRVIGNDETKTPPPPLQQVISRVIGADASMSAPPAVTQVVNRVISETTVNGGGGVNGVQMHKQLNGTAHVDGTAKPSLWQRIKAKGKALLHGDWSLKKDETALVGELGQETVIRDGKFFTVGDDLWQRIKAKGKALLHGDWSLKKDETALVGELGQETVIRDGKFFTVGDDGAEFTSLRRGDVVLNHKQTEELFKNGYVTSGGGRARVVGSRFEGTAHVEGTYQSGPLNFYGGATVLNNPKPVQQTQQAAQAVQQVQQAAQQAEKAVDKVEDKAEEAKKEQENFFDWIEVRLDRLTRKIDDLDKTASSVFHTFENRAKDYQEEFDKIQEKIEVATAGIKRYQEEANKVELSDEYIQKITFENRAKDYQEEFDKIQEKIEVATAGIKRYQEEANKVELSDEYIQKIKDGTIDLENITDETVNENIQKYKQWWDKSLDLQYSLTDLKEKMAEIQQAKFDLVGTEFDKLINKIQHTTDLYENQIGIIEARGQFAGRSYYEKLMENEEKKAAELEKKYQALIKAREEALASGTIEKGSQADLEMQEQIGEVELAWQDSAKAVAEYRNEIYRTEKERFDFMQDQVSLLSEETEFIRSLLQVGENDLFVKDVGVLNDKGKAYAAMAATNYDILMQKAQHTKDMIAHVNSEIANDPNNKTLMENRAELIRQQREIIQQANEEKKAIVDLMRESYNRMIDALGELIQKRKDLLQSTKDLYDYEKNVTKLGKDITATQKIIMSIENDDSEEAKARRQQLKDQLKEQQDSLYDAEYDQYLQDQYSAMDYMAELVEKILMDRLDNIDGILREILDYSNAHAAEINKTINDAAGAVGYDISDELKNIWSGTGGDTLSSYYKGWENSNNKVSNTVDGIYDALKRFVEGYVSLDLPKAPAVENKDARDDAGLGGPIAEPVKKDGSNLKVGDEFMATDAPIYATAKGEAGPMGTHQYFASDPHYKVLQDNGDYVLAQWYKGGVPAGWFKKSDLTPLETGGYTGDHGGVALLHGKERVLSAHQTKAFDQLVNGFLPTLEQAFRNKDVIKPGTAHLAGTHESNVDITFNLPNVQNSKEFMREIQNSKEFEKLVQHIAYDPLSKKSALRKNLVRVK